MEHYTRTYGVVPGSKPKSLAEFVAGLEADRPWSVFPIRSSEATMREEGCRAAAVEAGLEPRDPAIEDALTAKAKLQAWRRC
jgi:hypothetical protein